MNDRPSPFLYRMATWRARGFVCAALLVLLFTVGSAGDLFATVTAEAEATCEPADIVRVRVGDLHFNLPKEREAKLASKRKQLVFLALFGLALDKQHIIQKLNGKSDIGPANIYCQGEEDLAVDVFGFGLVPKKTYLQGLTGELGKSVSTLWVSKVGSISEERRADLLSSMKKILGVNSEIRSVINSNISKLGTEASVAPLTQYFVKLEGLRGNVFLVECKVVPTGGGPGDRCTFMALLGRSIILSGRFNTNLMPKKLWVERLQQVDVWYQGLRVTGAPIGLR